MYDENPNNPRREAHVAMGSIYCRLSRSVLCREKDFCLKAYSQIALRLPSGGQPGGHGESSRGKGQKGKSAEDENKLR